MEKSLLKYLIMIRIEKKSIFPMKLSVLNPVSWQTPLASAVSFPPLADWGLSPLRTCVHQAHAKEDFEFQVLFFLIDYNNTFYAIILI